MQVKVSVTKKHIKQGIKSDCSACPVALALLDAGFKKVKVGGYTMSASKLKGRTMHNIELPSDIAQKIDSFVTDFDLDREVVPFKFKLELTDKLAAKVGFGTAA